jgi:hypothetical protein
MKSGSGTFDVAIGAVNAGHDAGDLVTDLAEN